MSDKAFTNGQVQSLKDNIKSAKDRLDTLAKESSRFGELEAYPFGGLTLFPCGKVPEDREGMIINESNKLLLQDCLSILEQYTECEEFIDDEDNTDTEECDNLFTAIDNLNIEIDYDKIKNDNSIEINLAKNELKIDIESIKIDLTAQINNLELELIKKISNISTDINNLSIKITSLQSTLTNISGVINNIKNSIDILLSCPCNDDIVNSIKIEIENLKSQIGIELNTIKNNIDNIDVNIDGAEVKIDYEPIFARINQIRELQIAYQADIINNFIYNRETITQLIQDRFIYIRDRLRECCEDINRNIDNINLDLTPILNKIESSKIELMQAFNISIDNSRNITIQEISSARDALVSGQMQMTNIIIARIDKYLKKAYNGSITVQNKQGNEYNFPFSGLGLDGIHNTIIQLASAMELLNNQDNDDPCNNVVLVYSDRFPAQSLESQMEILFIEEGTKYSSKSKTVRMHVFNPREGLDFCRDIYPIVLHRGSIAFGRLDWKYNDNGKTKTSWTGGHFAREEYALSALNAIAALSAIPPTAPRITTGGRKKPVAFASFRPIRAVITQFDEEGREGPRLCLNAPPEGC
ncbi:hypothetical protein [Spirulina sp. 06S082]|uniref:hypothetical protein n=1 Tax=Spirulina sp. 06S082 TaxID=3110248 RepID=UPI002B216F5C|nr:hypothetical protein [Spirulina sp. 06S082]MEA5467983.1 hypothetical protein [Spirulina sp. 06S082]